MIERGQLRCWTTRRPRSHPSEGAGTHFIVLERAIGEAVPLGEAKQVGMDLVGRADAVGEIIDDPNAPANRFEGYADKGANESKILRNVVREGDAWFRSGDLVTRDERGYFYFVDRIGDTFRWKGENISTNEVAETINTHPGIASCAVYGIAIPGHDGKAGMAALHLSEYERFDLKKLSRHLVDNLPPHARPLFLRLRREADMTGTFKIRKVDLMKEGLTPRDASEPLYVFDSETGRYRILDETVREDILAGRLRL